MISRIRPSSPPPGAAWLALTLSAALAGCGTSPSTRFFTLDPVAAAAPPAAAYAGPPIRVEAVHIPSALDRPELVRQAGPNLLHVSDFARWAAPLGDTARRALTQDLAARLPNGAVIYPEAPKPAGARGLVVDILAVSNAGGEAVMDVSWTLQPPRAPVSPTAPTPPALRRTLRLTTPDAASGAASGAGADEAGEARNLSALLAQVADSVTADLAARRP